MIDERVHLGMDQVLKTLYTYERMVSDMMKINRKEKKYVKSLMAPEIPHKMFLRNCRLSLHPHDQSYYTFDVVVKGRIVGDAIFNLKGKYETGSW